jgi:NADH dehydrogenase
VSEVRAVDPRTGQIVTDQGAARADWLIVCLGSAMDQSLIPGGIDDIYFVKSLDEALALRSRLFALLQERRALRITVVGAGYSSVEVAGELAALHESEGLLRRRSTVDVQLFALEDRLLPEGNPRLALVAERKLIEKGVTLGLGRSIDQLERGRVRLDGGKVIPSDITIWAGQTRASQVLGAEHWVRGQRGRIQVDPYLRAKGLERVYIAGDAAEVYDYVTDRMVPANAQAALGQADVIAKNILAEIRGRPLREYRYRSPGEALSLGRSDGVAEVEGAVLTGRAAIAVKQAALLRYLATLGGPRLVRVSA